MCWRLVSWPVSALVPYGKVHYLVGSCITLYYPTAVVSQHTKTLPLWSKVFFLIKIWGKFVVGRFLLLLRLLAYTIGLFSFLSIYLFRFEEMIISHLLLYLLISSKPLLSFLHWCRPLVFVERTQGRNNSCEKKILFDFLEISSLFWDIYV